MSAFIVAKRHIDTVIGIALAHHVEGVTRDNAIDHGRTLWAENVRSVSHRYPGDRADIRDAERIADVYVYRMVPVPSIVQAAKILDCLEYQSCEHDGWQASEAAALIASIRGALLRALPGYEEAVWAVD